MWNYIKKNKDLLIHKPIDLPLNHKLHVLDNILKPNTPVQTIAGYTVSTLTQLLFEIVEKECPIIIEPPLSCTLGTLSGIQFQGMCNNYVGANHVTIRTLKCNKTTYDYMTNPKGTSDLREAYKTLASPKVLTKWLNKTLNTNFVTDIMYNKHTLFFLRLTDINVLYPAEKKVLADVAMFLIWVGWLKTTKMYKSTPSVDNLIEVYAEAVKRKDVSAEELVDVFADWVEKWHPELQIDIEKLIKENFKIDYSNKISEIQQKIHILNEDIQNYSKAITNRINSIREHQLHIESLTNAKDSAELAENILRMLKNYKTIVDFDFIKENNYLFYTVINNMKVDSAEDWKRNLDRRNLTDREKKLLYLALTTEDVNIRAIFRFAISPTYGFDWDCKCREINSKNYNAVRHPHLYHYLCYGNNENIINECYREQDYVALIEQTIEVVARLNWSDSPVVGRLIEDITSSDYYDRPIFEYKGTEFSLNDFTREGAQIYETINQRYPDA